MDTFLTTLYVIVDDWYKAEVGERRHVGARERMSDSEVLTVGLAGQWRVGVSWRSERGVVRWMQEHGRGWFPTMLGRSAFNARVRELWGVFIRLQQAVARWLGQDAEAYECVDGVPLVAMSNGQAKRESGHWLWESQTGHGGTTGGLFVGDHVLASVTPSGIVTGWLVGNADINERWLLSAFLSARTGCPELVAPEPSPHASRAERATPPLGHIGAFQAVGQPATGWYLADRGFNSRRWRHLWANRYAATVLSVPPCNDPERAAWSRQDCLWLASHRQIVDTVFARLSQVFDFEHLNAHSRWGQYTRIAAKIAAYQMRDLQTPQPTVVSTAVATMPATVDPNAPSATPRPPTPTLIPAPSVDNVGFPKDYQTNFKLMYVFDRPDNKTLRVICGNDAAVSWQPGQPFAEGSIMTMDVYRTVQKDGKPVLDSNGHFIRSQLNGIFVMRKEPGFGVDYKEFRNGDWEYAYRPDGSFLDQPKQTGACAACHLAQAGAGVDYTFRMNLFPLKAVQAPVPPANTVVISAYTFYPQKLTVKTGTTVTWINKDEAEFTITAKDGSFGSKTALKSIDVKPDGDTYSFTFDKAGTYDYFGNAGKTVTGTIEVTDSGS